MEQEQEQEQEQDISTTKARDDTAEESKQQGFDRQGNQTRWPQSREDAGVIDVSDDEADEEEDAMDEA